MDVAARTRLLWPRVAGVAELGGEWSVPPRLVVAAPEELREAVAPAVEAAGRTLGVDVDVGDAAGDDGPGSAGPEGRSGPAAGITLRLHPELEPAASVLELAGEDAAIRAGGVAGLRSALATLVQWTAIARGRGDRGTPAARIADAPEIATRGVLYDTSRDRVPTGATLHGLVDRLAAWKVDHLQLYFEHVFAYRGHEEVWREASAFTPEEIRQLDERCAARGIELAPCQNSFGHLHRWLRLPRYRSLAEVPEGLEHPWSEDPEPFSLCPTDPRSLELLDDLYGQLLPCFTSRLVNVGGDETFDLGRGRSAAACAERGSAAIWLDFVRAVRDLVARRGRRIAVWADVPLASAEAAEQLPDDVLALVWGYEAGEPFAEKGRRLAAAGREHWLVPGTSAWNSFAGRWSNAIANLSEAAAAARETGASGLLLAEWGDNGHLQPPTIAEPALFAGAGMAWRRTDPERVAWGPLLDLHVFRDPTGGTSRAALALGDAWRATGADPRNGTVLFRLLVDFRADLEHPRYRGMTAAGLERAEEIAAEAGTDLRRSRSAREDADLVRRELEWVAAALRLGSRLGRARLAAGPTRPVEELPAGERRRLAGAVGDLVEEHRWLWARRSRPGGLDDSARRLERLERALTG